MVFHQPFLTDLSSRLHQEADILLGKPMPVKTAAYYYQHLPEKTNGLDPFTQVQWLLDTPKRIHEYIELAKSLPNRLRANLEIDVGLHRGGFRNTSELRKALQLIQENQEWIDFSGFMGYDPHVVKLPKIIRSAQKAFSLSNVYYQECKDLLRTEFPDLWDERLVFNGGGSPTLQLHQNLPSPVNDLAAGSCLVKPSTFDIPSLMEYLPACFIASPILKKFRDTTLPAIEWLKAALNFIAPSFRQSFFIYGGYWKADYFYPKGTKENKLFGSSTNQTMINAPQSVQLKVDDFVFLRPRQSEFVFLHFGEILPVRDGKILTPWTILENK
jgi:D-serine deaminase-like pyridoxal phosphate-dependent protein